MEKSKKIRKKPSKAKTDIKAQINNEIIHAQGKFKQAKVGTIRDLVKKLKHPEKNPKQNRAAKTERYQNVLNQIKHVSPKRLGLLALVYYKSGKNYLADSQSTMEQWAVGYFSQFKGLSSILDVIRNKLDLDNAPDWRKLAKKLFKKKAEAVKKKKIGKEENALAESDNEDSGTGKVKQSNGKQEKSTKASGKKQKKQTGAPQQNTAAAVALKSEESSESDATEEEDDDSDAETAPPPTTVDDFFVTADGSNYVSTAVASEKPDDDSDDNSKGHTKQGKGFAKKPHESSFHQKNIKRPVKLATDRLDSGKKRKWTDDNEEESNVGKQLKADPNLHPSWQAKQKLKPTITEFKGTKITFD